MFKTWLLGNPAVCIADLEFGRDLYKVHADDLKHPWLTIERFVPGGTIREIDGARHEDLRRIRTRSLTATLVRSWEPALATNLSTSLAAMARSASSGRPIDPLPFVSDAVLAVWSDLLLGISPHDPDYDEVRSLVCDLDPDRHIYGTTIADDEIVIKLERLTILVQTAVVRGHGVREVPSLAARMEEVAQGL